MELKIGRNTYTINSDDRFLDNGSVVQLLTQSKEAAKFGHKLTLRLSKAVVKKINDYGIVEYKSPYKNCKYYGISYDT